MKKIILLVYLIVTILFLRSCDPLLTIYKEIVHDAEKEHYTTYGEIVHDAVKEHYTTYEILSLVQVQKNGRPTLYYFCVVDDTHDGIDVLWLSISKDENDDYAMEATIIADNIEFGKKYLTTSTKQDLTVEYLICEKKDIPDSVLQKIKFNDREFYFCITNIIDQTM